MVWLHRPQVIKRYNDLISVFGISRAVGLACLQFTLKGDALDELTSNFADDVDAGRYRNAASVIKILGEALTTIGILTTFKAE